jgi:hypothetical protein
MVKIPRAQSTSAYKMADPPRIPVNYGTGPGRAMAGLGQSIAGLGSAIEGAMKKAEGEANQQQEFQNNLALLKAGNDLNSTYADLTNKYETGQITKEQYQQKWGEYQNLRTSRLYNEAPPVDEKQKYKYDYQVERWRGGYEARSIENVDRITRTKTYNQTSAAIVSEFAPLAVVPEEAFEGAFQKRSQGIGRMIERAPLSDANKQKLRDYAASTAYDAIRNRFKDRTDELPWVKGFLRSWQAETQRQAQEAQQGPQGPVGPRGPVAAPNANFFTDRVPTSSQRRAIFRKGGFVVNLDTNWAKGDRQTTPMVVIPDNASPAQRKAAMDYAKGIAEVYEKQFGKSLMPTVVTRSQNRRGRAATFHTEPYAVTDSKAVRFFNSPEGQQVHASILANTFGKVPGVHFSIPHNPARGDRGAAANGVNEVELAKPVLALLQGGQASSTQIASADMTPPMSLGGPVGMSGAAGPTPPLPEQGAPQLVEPPELVREGVIPDGVSQEEMRRSVEEAGDGLQPIPGVTDPAQDVELNDLVYRGEPVESVNPVYRPGIDPEPVLQPVGGPSGTMGAQGEQVPPLLPEQAPLNLNALTQTLAVARPSFQTSLARILIKNLPKIQQDNVVARRLLQAQAKRMVDQQLATIATTGESHGDWDVEFVKKAWARNPEKLIRLEQDIKVARAVHGVVGDAENTPSDLLLSKLYALEDSISSEEGVDPAYLAAYEKVDGQVQRLLKLRESDPALAVKNSNAVKDFYKATGGKPVNTPELAQSLIRARLKAQMALGLKETPITKFEANQLLIPIDGAAPKDKRMRAMELVQKVHQVYGEYAEQVLQAATDLSTRDSEDDRDMLSAAQRKFSRSVIRPESAPTPSQSNDDGEQNEENRTSWWWPFGDTTADVDAAIAGKQQGRVPAGEQRNPYDQFD